MCGRRHGFTLIEVLAVVVVSAILAAAAAATLWTPLHSAQQRDAAQQVMCFEAQTRRHAIRNGPTKLVLRVGDRTITERNDGDTGVSRLLTLPSGCRIEEVRFVDRSAGWGEVVIECSASGYTPTYAVRLISPGNAQVWILFSGLTGRATTLSNEKDLEALFATLSSAGNDAD